MMWNGFGGVGWGGAGLGMLVFWGLVILGIVVLARSLAGRAGPGSGNHALEILKERYAKGELTHEQYEQMRKELQ